MSCPVIAPVHASLRTDIEPFLMPGSLARLEQPVLRAGGIVVRPWEPADAPAVVAGYRDPAIRHWNVRSMDDLGDGLAWIESWAPRWEQDSGAGWALADDDVVWGQISLRGINLDRGAAEISLWVLPEARCGGIAKRALAVVTRWSFEVLGLHRLEYKHSTQNPASCRVATGVGFRAEGVKRSEAMHSDGWHDIHVHARIATDRGTRLEVSPPLSR